jgi:NAD(P)-dependent dehydrogenase (short-subunit alcohol dehydrogenase family)
MKIDLSNKVVMYTGAAGLIGSASCKALFDAGARLALIDRDARVLEALSESISGSKQHQDILLIPNCNLLSTNEVDDAIGIVIARFGKVDCLVNCHYPRTEDWGDLFEDIALDSFRANVDMHLNSYFSLCQRVSLQMIKQGFGNIINFSSIYGVTGPDFSIYEGSRMTMPAGYSAIKGAITNLTRYLAAYLGPKGIRVNALCPGGVYNAQDEEFVTLYSQKVPLRRMARVDDIVGPLLFLVSDLSVYVNGINLPADGGWLAV